MSNFLFSGSPRIGGGLAITWLAGAAGVATFWELVGVNPETEEEEEAHGTLKSAMVKSDGSGRAVNYYVSPKDVAQVGKIDRVIVRRLQE